MRLSVIVSVSLPIDDPGSKGGNAGERGRRRRKASTRSLEWSIFRPLSVPTWLTPPSLRVAGRTVETDANTEIERDDDRVALSELAVGERVKVEGTILPNGNLLARKIEVDD